MSACGPRDPGVEALSSANGSALPFLPTLATALAVALLSLLCRAPGAPETPAAPAVTAQVSLAGADGFHPALIAAEKGPHIPAALAFAHLHPMTLYTLHFADAEDVAKPPPVRAARSTVAVRRPCTTASCGETRRADTAVRNAPAPIKTAAEPTAIPEPMRGQSEPDEGLLPEGALPFAASAASWAERVRKLGGSVGSGAASLGGSVVDLLASAR